MYDKIEIKEAHKHSIYHRDELRNSEKCECFYCTDIFDYKNIEDWCDDGDTALCPSCGIDSVIGRLWLSYRKRFFKCDEKTLV